MYEFQAEELVQCAAKKVFVRMSDLRSADRAENGAVPELCGVPESIAVPELYVVNGMQWEDETGSAVEQTSQIKQQNLDCLSASR
jgi:hypothetical protein